jgi:hypothetical protein
MMCEEQLVKQKYPEYVGICESHETDGSVPVLILRCKYVALPQKSLKLFRLCASVSLWFIFLGNT